MSAPAPLPPWRRRARALVAGTVLALVVLALLVGLSDLRALGERIGDLRWSWAAGAVAAALASYACIAATQRSLLAALGHAVPAILMARASLVSVVVSRTLRSGGTSGVAALSWLLARHAGTPASAVVTMHVGHVLLTNGVFVLLLAGGVAASVASGPAGDPDRRTLAVQVVAGGVLLATFLAGWVALAVPPVRRAWSGALERLAARAGRLARRPHWGERAHGAVERIARAARDLVGRPRSTRRAWAWAALRVAASLASLWCAVRAAGVDIGPGAIVTTFAAAKLAGTLAVVPAGLGIVEASLAGTLSAFGAPYEAALLAAIVHRIAYHLVPAGAALTVAGPLVREAGALVASEADAGRSDGEADRGA